MIITLTSDELDFVQEMTDRRCNRGKKSKRVSRYSEHEITYMGIAGEFAAAKGLGCLFNPFDHAGGDGHKGDLTRGPVTISLKTRAGHLPADFLFPTNQDPGEFPDDFGVVGRWIERYSTLQLIGFFTKNEYPALRKVITVGGTRSGQPETRNGIREFDLAPIEVLEKMLSEIKDETVRAYQERGYIESFRDRDYSRRSTTNIGDVYPQLANLLA